MKKLFITSLLLLFLLTPQNTYAHVLKTDGSIGAVVHVSPEDDPIAGESTDFFFEFKDKESKFNPENCACNGIILQDGKEIYSAPLFQNSPNPSLEDASFSFTFPQKDVYKVRVSGKPTTTSAFEPFTLTWDIRVARESETQQLEQDAVGNDQQKENTKQTPYILYFIGALLIAGFGIYLLKKRG